MGLYLIWLWLFYFIFYLFFYFLNLIYCSYVFFFKLLCRKKKSCQCNIEATRAAILLKGQCLEEEEGEKLQLVSLLLTGLCCLMTSLWPQRTTPVCTVFWVNGWLAHTQIYMHVFGEVSCHCQDLYVTTWQLVACKTEQSLCRVWGLYGSRHTTYVCETEELFAFCECIGNSIYRLAQRPDRIPVSLLPSRYACWKPQTFFLKARHIFVAQRETSAQTTAPCT